MDVAGRICSAAYIIVCCPDDMAQSAMVDAVDRIRQTRYYRHEVKMCCRQAMSAYDVFRRKLKETLSEHGKWEFWMDYADLYQERMAQHVMKLRLAFKHVLDTEGVDDADMRSYVLTADTLLNLSVVNFDRYFNSMYERHRIDVRGIYMPARLDGVKRTWERVCGVVLAQPADRHIDLDGSGEIRLALKALDTQMTSPDLINSAGEAVLAMYPEIDDSKE